MYATERLGRDPNLTAILRRVVDLYEPERVYLFGSQARGDAGPDSDYDLMVLVPDDAEPERADSKRFYQHTLGLPCGADVVVIKRSAFEGRAEHVVASLPATVLREGQLLYAAQ